MLCPTFLQGRGISCPRSFTGAHLRLSAPHLRGQKCVVRMSMKAPPVEFDVLRTDGTTTGTEVLSLKVADQDKAKGIVHRYLMKVRGDMRAGTANTKTRAEVRGGGRKPYQQKGTGRARRGSSRSPLIVGGGVAFGPKPRDYSVKMNKKERRLAMGTAIQSAAGDILVCETLDGKLSPKTKSVVETLDRMGLPPTKHCLVITSKPNEILERCTKNVAKLVVNRMTSLSVYDILRADKILIEQEAFHHIQGFYGENSQSKNPAPAPEMSEVVPDTVDRAEDSAVEGSGGVEESTAEEGPGAVEEPTAEDS